MARLLTDAENTPSTSSTAGAMGEASEPRKVHNVSSRRLSFKTRQTPRAYRSTKVTLSSNNVALIASKFNTIIIEDDKKGRALFRRLSSARRSSLTKVEAKANTRKLEESESVVKAAIQIFEQDVEQRTTKTHTAKSKLVLVRKHSSNKPQTEPNSSAVFQNSAKEVISAKLDSEVKQLNSSKGVKNVEFQRKPSLKAKPLLRNTGRTRSSDLGVNFNQRVARFNNSDGSTVVDNVNKNVDSVKYRRSLGCEVSQRIEQFNVNEGGLSFGKKEHTVETEKKDNVLNVTRKLDVAEKNITEKKQNANVNTQKKKENIGSVEKENKVSELVNNEPVSLVDRTKERLALNVKDSNSKPKVHPKPNVITTQKQSSSLYNMKLNSSELKLESLKTHKSTVILKENVKENNSKRLSIPKDPTILEHVFDPVDPDEPKENKDKKTSLVRPNSSFLWKSNSALSITEIPLKEVLDIRNNKDIKPPPPTKPKNGFKTTQVSIVNEAKEPVEINKQLNGYNKFDNTVERVEDNTESKNVNGDISVYGLSKEKENITHSLNIDVADSFMLEMNEHIEKQFSYEFLNYEIIYNKTDENAKQVVGSQNKSTLYNSAELKDKQKSNENIQKLLVEEMVTKKFLSLHRLSIADKRRSADVTPKSESGSSSPNIPPPTLIRNRSPARGNTLDRTVNLLQITTVPDLPNERSPKLPPPVLRHLKKDRQVQLNSKTEDLSSSEEYFSSKFSQNSDHYTLVGGEEDVGVEDVEAYEDVGEQENSYAVIKEYEDERHNIYDDVLNMHGQTEDHYEAINPVPQPDSDSSCDQSNSLYGMRPSSRGSSGGVYQTGPGGQPTPRSETSDEWMDVDNSDDQNEKIVVYRDKPTRSWSSAGGWSQKVRRQWSKRAGNRHTIQTDGGSDGSGSHSYEYVEETNDATVCDDFDDSFDSDSSAEEATEVRPQEEKNSRVLPEPPRDREGIYGFMKQAGKRMRKHWPLGKSLRSIGKINVNMTSSVQTTSDQGRGTNSTTSLNRRRWPSFKSKFKPPVQNQSTFYLNSTNEDVEKQNTPEVTNYGESKVDSRRLSTASMIRPSSPPPPPPPPRNPTSDASKRSSLLDDSERKPSVQSDDTSKRMSVATTGDDVGKRASLISTLTKELISTFDKTDSNGTYAEGQQRLTQTSNSNWYLDISWPSTDSASEHGSSQGSEFHLTFADEPLYQFYTANIAEMSRSELNCDDSDGYEEIASLVNRPSAMDLIMPHHRTLWCEIPEVKNSGIFDQLSPSERKLQEAKFEVMTSEASYFKSLTVLEKHFASCPMFTDETILPSQDRKVLFSHVSTVRKCSEKLLAALEMCWQNSILLSGLCKILYEHVKHHFYIYVKYCSNQIYIDKTLKHLRLTNSNFNDILNQLEADSQCQSLSLHSFLMLPMQRITRMPLLVDAILSRLNSADPEFTTCEILLATLNKIVADCNEGARTQERYEEMLKLSQQLEFCREVRTLPILSPLRWLIRSGQLTQVNMDAKLTFGRRLARTGPKITLFLFTDLLVVAKKKGDDSYLVVDHCSRNLVQISEMADVAGNNRHLLVLTMLENHEMKTVEMMLCCESETVRQRWLQAVRPPTSTNPDETVYEDWDCPQVSAVHSYSGGQPDELSLQLGDVVNVFRKMADGWYYGQRIRDGETGWFPANHSVEIASMHVRAKNLKQRWRFLALSGNYVEEMKRKSKI